MRLPKEVPKTLRWRKENRKKGFGARNLKRGAPARIDHGADNIHPGASQQNQKDVTEIYLLTCL
jgi:hypothetical protein